MVGPELIISDGELDSSFEGIELGKADVVGEDEASREGDRDGR